MKFEKPPKANPLGNIKVLDEKCRLIIPLWARKHLGLTADTVVEILPYDDKTILIQKVEVFTKKIN